MEKIPKYSISPASEVQNGKQGFLIFTDSQDPITNHLGTAYSPLPEEVAAVLVEDINEILLLDAYPDRGANRKALTFTEVFDHPEFEEIRKMQEKSSFAISVHNALMVIQDDPEFRFELENVIQWDFLYRMSPGPKEKMEQMSASYEAIQWLGKDWVDLPGNYARTPEDMEADEIPFVPQVIVDRLNAEIASMTLPEKVAVWYLYEFFYRFSITIPILWVKGAVSGVSLEESYSIFVSDYSLKKIRWIRKKNGDFVQKRLGYLGGYLRAMSIEKS